MTTFIVISRYESSIFGIPISVYFSILLDLLRQSVLVQSDAGYYKNFEQSSCEKIDE